jgi:hypothetical protein
MHYDNKHGDYKVYFFPERGVDEPAIKIGFSKDPVKRLKQIQTGHSSKIGCEGWVNTHNGPLVEKAFHERFAKDRIRGEWFRFSDELKTYLNQLKNSKDFTRYYC